MDEQDVARFIVIAHPKLPQPFLCNAVAPGTGYSSLKITLPQQNSNSNGNGKNSSALWASGVVL